MVTTSWKDIGLSKPILSAIKELGFKKLTPVQAACIPVFLTKRRDVAVEAVTGSGKTLSFLIPVLEVLLKLDSIQKHDVLAIIISPTRELASQTFDITTHFLKRLPQLSHILLIGGESVSEDINKIKKDGANIIVATPGRLADLFNQKKILNLTAYVKTLEVLVLDEADRLLDMGFEKTINTILSYLPKQRQTGLFSATQTKEMEDLMRAGLRNPICVSVKEKANSLEVQRTPSSLSNFYTICEPDEKFSCLVNFLQSREDNKCMVFFSTCASVNYFTCILKVLLKDIPVISIHGKMKRKRNEVFSNFKKYEKGVLLCTDVMARGVDIPDVHWVIQFDPPSTASSFVHRCGRTARIGKTGNALIMLLPNEETFVNFLDVNQKVKLEHMEMSPAKNVTSVIRNLAMKDRYFYEKGMRAFVSFIRFYTKHECTLLFRVKDLDIGKLADGFALLKLPIMPELRRKTISNFTPVDVNFEQIPFLNKEREIARLKKLKEFKENPEIRKAAIEKRKKLRAQNDDKKKKKSLIKKKRKRRVVDAPEDVEDFARDARLLKKFKKGKISQEEFDAEFAADLKDEFE